MKKTVAVLTPTYNRGYILGVLFESLKRQTCFDFKWYIVDDGSTDDTKETCENFRTESFEIVYVYKNNGGKHTAVNKGVELIEEDLTFIVDSDDYLTDDAIEKITYDWKRYSNIAEVGGLSYYRIHADGSVIGDVYGLNKDFIDSYINVRINRNVGGDKAEVYRTDLLKTYKFPVFDGERFCSEAIVWAAISRAGYNLAFIEKGIYVCEYREDGLTNEGRLKIKKNPEGYLEHARLFLFKDVKQIYQWKYTLLYIVTSLLAGHKIRRSYCECNKKIKYICSFPFAIILLMLFKMKKLK